MAKKVQIERNREFILILLRCSLSWGTKVQIKSEKLTPFGGIFPIMEQFSIILGETIDSTLGLRCSSLGYQYSEIIRSLMCVYFCGGSCVEDISSHLMACLTPPPSPHLQRGHHPQGNK